MCAITHTTRGTEISMSQTVIVLGKLCTSWHSQYYTSSVEGSVMWILWNMDALQCTDCRTAWPTCVNQFFHHTAKAGFAWRYCWDGIFGCHTYAPTSPHVLTPDNQYKQKHVFTFKQDRSDADAEMIKTFTPSQVPIHLNLVKHWTGLVNVMSCLRVLFDITILFG